MLSLSLYAEGEARKYDRDTIRMTKIQRDWLARHYPEQYPHWASEIEAPHLHTTTMPLFSLYAEADARQYHRDTLHMTKTQRDWLAWTYPERYSHWATENEVLHGGAGSST